MILKNIYYLLSYINKFYVRYIISPLQLSAFGKKGKRCRINKNCLFVKHSHIFIGNNVNIGPNAIFYASKANIYIGDYVMFGPNVTLLAGGHRFDNINIPMSLCKQKLPTDDKDIIIKNDVWIGANVTVLKGVTINEGCVIGAGSVVTKDTLSYGVYVGNPAKLIRFRIINEE